MNQVLTKIFFFLLFSISLISSINANEIYVDINGWCPNIPINFTLYDSNEWEDREEIIKDRDRNLTIIENTRVIIYDGPFDSMNEIINSVVKSNTFSFTFLEAKPYLIRFEPEQEGYENLDVELSILECQYSPHARSPENLSLRFNQYDLGLIFTNTKLNANDIELNRLDNSFFSELIEDDEKIIGVYQLEKFFNDKYEKLEIAYSGEEEISRVRLLNQEENLWTRGEFEEQDELSIITIGEAEIFALIGIDNTLILNTEINTTLNQTTNQSNQTNKDVFVSSENQQEDEGKNNTILFLIVGVVIVGGVVFYLLNRTDNKDLYSSDEYQEVLTSYNQEYERTKEYIRNYKNSYSKEQIKIALQQAKVHDDIIEKVFLEEGVN